MSQKKLLLADDSITIQKVVNLTFADEGIDVVTVGDGDAAIAKWAEEAPDLILADVNMPGLNGYQVCEKIKQSDNSKKTPVILLVGSFEPFDEEEAKRVGADDFLTKPFQSIRQLVSKVTDLLGASASSNRDGAESGNAATSGGFPEMPETKEFAAPPETVGAFADVSYDNGMDDEMIQTNQPGSFAFDESQKFETRETSEPAEDGAGIQQLSAEYSSQFSPAEIVAKDVSRPEPDSEFDDFLELPDDEEDWETDEEEEKEAAKTEEAAPPAQETAKTGEPASETVAGETFEPEIAVSEHSAISEINAADDGAPATNFDVSQSHDERQTENLEDSSTSVQFSPETIDAIAQKVVEKLSDKAVREIAWEVVPQLADLIIKKMAEEKFKK